MINKLFYNFIIFLFISFSAASQKKPIKFQSINEAGIAVGESEVNGVLQTVNGIEISNWFAGVGIGIDYYRYQTAPLFFDVRRYFDKENKGFVYIDLGYNIPWKDKPGKEISYYNSYHFTGGVYTGFGIGYRLSVSKKTSILFSLGHSYKKLRGNIGVISSCPFIGPCFEDYSKYDFGYGRMILKTGLVF